MQRKTVPEVDQFEAGAFAFFVDGFDQSKHLPPNSGVAKQAQVARQLVDSVQGFALGETHLIIDRDTKYVNDFRNTLEAAGVKIVLCPPRVPQCNAYAERFVRSIKQECLSRLIFLSERQLKTAIATFADYYRQRRNHQGIQNKLIDPPTFLPTVGHIP